MSCKKCHHHREMQKSINHHHFSAIQSCACSVLVSFFSVKS